MRSTTKSIRSRPTGSKLSPLAVTSHPDASSAAPLPTSNQTMWLDLDSGTSSPGSVAGRMRSVSPGLPTMPTSGPGPVRARDSATRARGAEHSTLDIFGRHGSTSSDSAALQRSLESRLRVRLASTGSILFVLTWRDAVTPSGHRICALRASARRTSDSDCTSWPTPVVNDAKGSDYAYSQGDHGRVWRTPLRSDVKGKSSTGYISLGTMASWITPAAREAGGTPKQFLARKAKAKAKGANLGESLTSLSMQALLIGATLSGSHAPTERVDRPQLNPCFSLWLMGYPAVWGRLAVLATRSSRKSSPRSSAQPKRRG